MNRAPEGFERDSTFSWCSLLVLWLATTQELRGSHLFIDVVRLVRDIGEGSWESAPAWYGLNAMVSCVAGE